MKKLKFAIMMILSLIIASNTFAQKKPKDKLPTTVLTLRPSNCSPVAEPAVLTILEKGDLVIGSLNVDKEKLAGELLNRVCDKQPSDQIIYINANVQTPFAKILEILRIGRDIDIDDATLNIIDKNSVNTTLSNRVKIPTQDEENSNEKIKAYPLALFVLVENDGILKLNAKPENSETLAKKLKQIFATRKQKKIYIAGSKEVEKTVFVSARETVEFGTVIKVIETLQKSGTTLIGIDVDNFYDRLVFN